MRDTYIYLLRPVGHEGPVKIGFSRNPLKRLSQQMTWSPFRLEIAATFPGDEALEENLHQCFSDLHSHGEWFKPHPRLSAFIANIRSGIPVHESIDLNAKLGPIHNKAKKGKKTPFHLTLVSENAA